jgi:molybdopterin guanine dinucleotide-containing S/N-oxide reductase-like protein
MPKNKELKTESGQEKSFLKALGFCANTQDGNTSVIDVKEGKIIRIRPLHFDWKYKPEEYNPWKIKARGKTFEPDKRTTVPPLSLSYKKRVYSPNRVLFPLKRFDFDPNGERNPQNRGTSGYVRISWDEALDIITAEIRRVIKQYGPYAIFSQSDGHGETKVVHFPHGCHQSLLEMLGGYTLQARNPDSWEGWWWGGKHVWGFEPVGIPNQSNLATEVARHTDLLVGWGCDPESTQWAWSGQIGTRLRYWYHELGIRYVFICPDLSYTAALFADKWIPIYPNTDAALQLALAYVWITEDTYDKEYLKTHSIGFEKFKDYVLGKEDGIPKTPKWAEPLTGVPNRIIKALARDWASKRTTTIHGLGGSMIRGPYSTEPARLIITLLAMQGLGKPGVHFFKMVEWGYRNLPTQFAFPKPIAPTHLGKGTHGAFPQKYLKQVIPKDMVHDAILKPPISWWGGNLFHQPREDQFKRFTYPVEGLPEVHLVWTDSPSWVTCWNDSNQFVKAFQSPKIEFILAQHPWMENDCLLADIVLPVSTKFEEDDIAVDVNGGEYNITVNEEKCIEPLGESKSDWEITCMIAERLGLLKEYSGGLTVEDCKKTGFEKSGIAHLVSYEDLKKKGYFITPTDPDWEKIPPGLRLFYEDPEKNPLPTPTGKLEIFSQPLADHFPDDKERPPIPKWIPYGETHQESRLCERAKKYPLLMVTNHPRWAVHSQHKDISWLREIPTSKIKGPDGYLYHPLWIHPVDAEAREIKQGDVVSVFNERGIVLCGAYVTERMIPGAVSSDHGAAYDPIVPGEIDRGGANNTICEHNTTSKNATGMATSAFLVEIAKANLEELRRKYPMNFNRPYHPGSGICLDRVMHQE